MKPTKTVFILCCLFCAHIGLANAADTHSVKGVVVTPNGTVVPEFSVVVRHVTDKPQLIERKHFKDGEFTIDGLASTTYQLHIASPNFVGAKLEFDFKSRTRDMDYSIVVLHPYRNETRYQSSAYPVSVKAVGQRIPDAAREAYLKAVSLHRDGKMGEALIEYGKALRAYPQYLDALIDIGTIFLLYDRPVPALTFLRRAKDIDDCNPLVNLNIAVGLTEQGDYGAALKLLKDVLSREPRMAMAQFAYAKISYLQKKYDQADLYLNQALENDPKLLDAWVLKINVSLDRENYDETRAVLQRVREAISSEMLSKFIDEQLLALGG